MVVVMEACPMIFCTSCTWAPLANASVANAWRKLWKWMPEVIFARSLALAKRRETP